MSVGKWLRGETRARYVQVAIQISRETKRLLCKENLFPKRQRWLDSKEIVYCVNSLRYHTIHANELKVKTKEECEYRHKEITKALSDLKTLDVLLYCVISDYSLNADYFENLAGLMIECEKLLNGILAKETQKLESYDK